ncbi:MAG: hypothetical protein WBW41_19830 [Verrucomicrobiia bacterium]
MIHALTGVEEDFLPDGAFALVPPGDRRAFGRRSFLAPVTLILN